MILSMVGYYKCSIFVFLFNCIVFVLDFIFDLLFIVIGDLFCFYNVIFVCVWFRGYSLFDEEKLSVMILLNLLKFVFGKILSELEFKILGIVL